MVVKIRAVTDEDCSRLWELVNDPTARASAFQSAPIAWAEHVTWFRTKRADPHCSIYLITDETDQPIGQVRFEIRPDGSAEVDVSVVRDQRERGYGTRALQIACAHLFDMTPVRRVVGRVKSDNRASLRAFEKAGFSRCGREVVNGFDAVQMVLCAMRDELSREAAGG